MIHAYDEVYLNGVIKNIAALFHLAINEELIDPDEFAYTFSHSSVASGIEYANPKDLAGISAVEMFMDINNKEAKTSIISLDRTPEYWAGWVLAYAQWYLNKSFKDILSVISFSSIIDLYSPYHEASEMKTVDLIASKFKAESSLKKHRQINNLTQEELATLSGVNVRTIRSYEQQDNDITKAQYDILYKLSRVLNCTIEELVK